MFFKSFCSQLLCYSCYTVYIFIKKNDCIFHVSISINLNMQAVTKIKDRCRSEKDIWRSTLSFVPTARHIIYSICCQLHMCMSPLLHYILLYIVGDIHVCIILVVLFYVTISNSFFHIGWVTYYIYVSLTLKMMIAVA